MPGTYRKRCLVLKKTKLGETDTILTMLGSDGQQVRAVAKGLRKPGNRIGARLEPFSVAEILLHRGRNLDIVGETRSLETNAKIREDLLKTAAASVVAEFLEKVSRDGALVGEKVFPLSLTALGAMREGGAEQAGAFAAAQLFKAMAMQGFCPAVHRCASCGRPLEGVRDSQAEGARMARFEISAGGALCEECAALVGGSGVAPELVGWIDFLLHSTFVQIAAEDVRNIPTRRLLDLAESWAREHLSLNLRAMGFLKSLY